MKYGPIICDPNSEEAKKLIGKKVIGSDSYTKISSLQGVHTFELAKINADEICPFMDGRTEYSMGYNFIREVIEEKPKYRPYKDTNEMVEDYKERFKDKIITSPVEMPMIWVTFPNGPKEIVSAFGKNTVWLNGDCFMLDYIFETDYTYLDGSPVGKEVKE